MPIAWAPTMWRVISKVAIEALRPPTRAAARARARAAGRRASPCRRGGSRPGMRTLSKKTSAVCEARRPCLRSFVPCSSPCDFRLGYDERRLTLRPERRVDGRDDDVDVGDAAVRGPRLLPVDDPLSGRLVVRQPAYGSRTRRNPHRARTSRTPPPVRRRRAVAPRHPLAPLLRRAVGEDRGDCRGRCPSATSRCRRRPRTAPRGRAASAGRTGRRTG